MSATSPSFIVVSTNTTSQRDSTTQLIYNRLVELNKLVDNIKIVKEGVGKIKVFHTAGNNTPILIRTYLIVVIPVIVNMTAIESIYGNVYFDFNNSIEQLESALKKLRAIEGHRKIKSPLSTKDDLEQILNSLLA